MSTTTITTIINEKEEMPDELLAELDIIEYTTMKVVATRQHG